MEAHNGKCIIRYILHHKLRKTSRTERCRVKLKLNAEQLLILAELIEENKDATLEELRYLLYKKLVLSSA